MTAIATTLERAAALAAILIDSDLYGPIIALPGGLSARDLQAEFAAAAEAARKAAGNRRPTLSEASMHARLEAYVRAAGTAKAAAAKLGIAQSFLCDIRNARRRAPDYVIAALGYRRVGRRREFEEI